jgi:hypothetical protein
MESTGRSWSLERRLFNAGHVRHFVVTRDTDGWEVSDAHDSTLLRRIHRVDWHRVEQDTLLFDLEARVLKQQGWIEPTSSH